MTQLSEFDKGRLIGMLEAGLSIRQVASKMNCCKRTVEKWWQRFREEGHARRKEGSGRPAVTDTREDRRLVLAGKRERFSSMRVIYRWYPGTPSFSLRTAYRRMASAGYRSYRPAVRIPLSLRHRRARLDWCRNLADAPDDFWRKILWTDESRFCLDFHDGRVRVRRLPNERYNDCCITEHDRHGGGGVMVWGGVWHDGKTELMHIEGTLNADKYRDLVMTPIIIPTCDEFGLTLQQDNATPHTANSVNTVRRSSSIFTIDWPARSPDLSPIEHVWDVLQRRLQQEYSLPPATPQQLLQRLRELWNLLPQDTIRHVIDSVPRRLQQCIQSYGGHTRY